MSRVFAAGSSEQAVVDSTPVTAAPITVACWARCTDTGSNFGRRVVGIGDKDVTNHNWGLRFSDVLGTQTIRWAAIGGGSEAVASASGNWVNNTWHHVAGVEASSTSRFAYLDGAVGSENTTSISPSGADRVSIGVIAESAPNAAEYFTGDIAEVGIWDVALTAAEILALSKGVLPKYIRPANLVFYAPMGRDDTAVRDLVGGLSLTLTGTSASAHPRVFRKRPRVYGAPTPLTTTVTPGNASLTVTGYAPVIQYGYIPSTASLTTALYAPTVSTSSGTILIPDTANLTLSALAPITTLGVTPDTASLTIAQFAPVVVYVLHPANGALSVSGLAPLLLETLPTAAPTALVLTQQTPNAIVGTSLTPGTGSLTTGIYAPTLSYGYIPGTGSIVTAQYAPDLLYTINLPSAASLVVTQKTPTVIATIDAFGRVVLFNAVNTDPVGSIRFGVASTDPVGSVKFSVSATDPVGSIEFSVAATDPVGTIKFSTAGSTVTFNEPEEI